MNTTTHIDFQAKIRAFHNLERAVSEHPKKLLFFTGVVAGGIATLSLIGAHVIVLSSTPALIGVLIGIVLATCGGIVCNAATISHMRDRYNTFQREDAWRAKLIQE